MSKISPEIERSGDDDSASKSGNPLVSLTNRVRDAASEVAQGVAEGVAEVTGTSLNDREYAAFISYSHRDMKTARWLHRAIETYRVPKSLVGQQGDYGPVPARLRPVFRDEDELAGAAQLGPKLEGALSRSRALIVICSPASRRSSWVDKEIRTFKRLNPGRPVFAVVAEGTYGDDETACFPQSLLWELDEAGELDRTRPLEPLAPDFQVLEKRIVKLKLIAGMLGVPFDRLNDREQRRRRTYGAIMSTATLVLIAVLSGLSIVAIHNAQVAVREANAAEKARAIAERERNDAIEARDLAERKSWLAQQAANEIRSFVGQDCVAQALPQIEPATQVDPAGLEQVPLDP